MYRPAQEEMTAAVEWLRTPEGHDWQSQQALNVITSVNGMTGSAWISVKEDPVEPWQIIISISVVPKVYAWHPRDLTGEEKRLLTDALHTNTRPADPRAL